MASTTFTARVTKIAAAWLNEVNTLVHTVFSAATTAAEARTALDVPSTTDLNNHLNDSADAHDASAISVADSGGLLAATDVEAALAEIATEVDDHLADATDAHDASAISILDTGARFTGTEVETALTEVPTLTGNNALSGDNTLSGNNTLSGDNNVKDTVTLYDPSDTTKKARFDVGGITTATTRVITIPDRDLTLGPVLGSVSATTSGTTIDYTNIPSWVRRITIMLAGVSTSGTSEIMIQIGDSGGVETTSYIGATSTMSGTTIAGSDNYSTGFLFTAATAAESIVEGIMTLILLNPATNTWTCMVAGGNSNANATHVGGGYKALSGTLDRIRLTTINGTDTFDAGSINIMVE